MTTSQELNDSFDELSKTALRIKKERDDYEQLLKTAYHALRSYEHGNAEPDLARRVADRIVGIVE